jgi:hypothetical protein
MNTTRDAIGAMVAVLFGGMVSAHANESILLANLITDTNPTIPEATAIVPVAVGERIRVSGIVIEVCRDATGTTTRLGYPGDGKDTFWSSKPLEFTTQGLSRNIRWMARLDAEGVPCVNVSNDFPSPPLAVAPGKAFAITPSATFVHSAYVIRIYGYYEPSPDNGAKP